MPSHRFSLMHDNGVSFGVQIPLSQLLGPHWPSGSQSVSVAHGMHGSAPPVEQRGPGWQRSAKHEPPGALFPAPSSHSSPQSSVPSPQPGGTRRRQSAEQPPTFGVSHSSRHSTVPLPQFSIWQVDEQPSHAVVLPSSQVSAASMWRSPHTLSRREQSP